MRNMLEPFLDRVRSKAHILEILPAYSLTCCMISENDRSAFIISKGRIELIDRYDSLDIKVEGPSEILCQLFSGAGKLTDEKLVFRGSFRQFLLLDSLLNLTKEPTI
ncbi:hypothetical protein LC085_07325 [Bacillus tianshenii]|uniref:hypothetical protein n=1 Tax=Sutcliffiella tianshenii TaxID=1463404 RepID=UPI001CD278A4|nr:hypothetical protein [Bacillus tianshenii]MCA1319722.1 hypothetical protein [Bacillus tianshenii]